MDHDDRQRIAEYRHALAGFRLDRGDRLESVVAALLDAVLLLHDPARCVYPGEDAHCASEYDVVASRIWERLLQHHYERNEFGGRECAQIVYDEIDREFRAVPLYEVEFSEIVNREFGVEVPPLVHVLDTTFHDPPNTVRGFVDELMNQLQRIGGFEP
ncbi:MAG: hypothetical protein KGR47_00420 [Acidobacteria bacterium]|nr:hypothetical protein [Acidobacteriota bacterium]